MNRLSSTSNVWPFGLAPSLPYQMANGLPQQMANTFSPQQAQLMLLQQQLHHKSYLSSTMSGQSSFDLNMFTTALHQRNSVFPAPPAPPVYSNESVMTSSSSSNSSSSTSSPINNGNTLFTSSFSVNSLLNGHNSALTPEKVTNMNQQAATVALTQHLASAMANYRLYQQQSRLPAYPVNESAFQQPSFSSKRIKLSDDADFGLNLSQGSTISSPGSSSSSVSSSDFSGNGHLTETRYMCDNAVFSPLKTQLKVLDEAKMLQNRSSKLIIQVFNTHEKRRYTLQEG